MAELDAGSTGLWLPPQNQPDPTEASGPTLSQGSFAPWTPSAPQNNDIWNRPEATPESDQAGQQAASDWWKPLGDLFSGLGTAANAVKESEPVQNVLTKAGQASSWGSGIAQGELGNLSAGGENINNWLSKTFPNLPYGAGAASAQSTKVNDAYNAAAAAKYAADLAVGADTSDPLYAAQIAMDAGKAAWGATDIPVPVVKGALEGIVDPSNLAFSAAGPALGMVRKAGAAGKAAAAGLSAAERAGLEAAVPKTIAEASAGAGTAIDAAAHADDLSRLQAAVNRVNEGKGTLDDTLMLKDANSVADTLEAKGRADQAQAIRDAVKPALDPAKEKALEGKIGQLTDAQKAEAKAPLPKGPPSEKSIPAKLLPWSGEQAYVNLGKGADAGSNLERMLAEGGDQSKAGLADRLTEAGGGTSQATQEFNAGLKNIIDSKVAPEVKVTGRNSAMGAGQTSKSADIAANAETKAAVKERDTALKSAGIDYEGASDAAKERFDRMFGVADTGDPKMDALSRILAPLSNVSNTMRTAMTSWDFSMGRQAAGLAGGAPGSLGKGFAAQGKGLLMNDAEFRDATAKIISEVDSAGGIDAGLHISGPGAFQEEKYIGSGGLQKMPGVKGSEQAYTHGLNVARADAYVTGVKNMEEAAGRKLTDEERKQFASYVNHATGRGDVPDRLKGAFEAVNGIFFAPRYRLSRAQVATDTAGAMGSVIKDVMNGIKTGKVDLNPVDLKVLEYTGKYVATIESLMRGAQFAEHLAGRENTYSDVGTPFTPEDATAGTFGKLDVGAPGTPGADVAGALELVGGGSSVYNNRSGEGQTVKMDLWSGYAPELRTVIREFNNLRGLVETARTGVRPKGTDQPGLPAYLRQGEAPLPGLIHTAISGKHDATNFGQNAVGADVKRSDWTSTDITKNPILNEVVPLSASNALQDMGIVGPPGAQGSGGGKKSKY